jgi:hypothetical protein
MTWLTLQHKPRGKCNSRALDSRLGSQRRGCLTLPDLEAIPEIHPWNPESSLWMHSWYWTQNQGLPGALWMTSSPLAELLVAFRFHRTCFSFWQLAALNIALTCLVRYVLPTVTGQPPCCRSTPKHIQISGSSKPKSFYHWSLLL